MGAFNLFLNANISNPNLLDNPWFTVNQRGAMLYNTAGYTLDRWKIESGVTVNIDTSVFPYSDVRIASAVGLNFEQIVNLADYPHIYGSTLTLSVKRNNNIEWFSFSVQNEKPSSAVIITQKVVHDNILILVQLTSSDTLRIIFRSNDGNPYSLRAVKLEYGEHSTLANDHVPDYATELLKCQRYYEKGFASILALAANYSSGLGGANIVRIYGSVHFETMKRANPAVVVKASDDLSDGVSLWQGTPTRYATIPANVDQITKNGFRVYNTNVGNYSNVSNADFRWYASADF